MELRGIDARVVVARAMFPVDVVVVVCPCSGRRVASVGLRFVRLEG